MEKLNANWFVEGLIDLEYKQYILLAYLNNVKQEFENVLLYPAFADLIFHYSNLKSYLDNKQSLTGQFPKSLKGIDPEKFKLKYEPDVEIGPGIQEIQEIVEYAIPLFKEYLEEGKGIYHFIDDKIAIDPVGLLPLYRDEGYLLLHSGKGREVKVYEYHTSIFEDAKEKFRGLHTHYLRSFQWGLSNTFEHIKLSLIRENTKLPNPATFAVLSEMDFPEQRALLPVVKRKFIRKLSML